MTEGEGGVRYRMSEDVYLVDGGAFSAIYDLPSGRLHRIRREAAGVLRTAVVEGLDACPDGASAFLDALAALGLVERAGTSSAPSPMPDIRALARPPAWSRAWMEVTDTCNLECSHCYESSSPQRTRRMSLPDFEIAVDRLAEAGVDRVQLIGGEPLALGRTLREMITVARPRFESLTVYTNGTLITDEWATFFAAHDVGVVVSVHSYMPDQHDALSQRKGAHRRTMRGLRHLDDKGVGHRVSGNRMKGIRPGERGGADYRINFDPIRLAGRAGLEQIDDEIFERKAITRERFMAPLNRDRIIDALSGHNCFASRVYVSVDLTVYPCVMERRHTHGRKSLREASLEALADPWIRGLTKDDIEGCRGCEFRYACFDCRPDSAGGGFLAKPWYCTYRPETGEWVDPREHLGAIEARGVQPLVQIDG